MPPPTLQCEEAYKTLHALAADEGVSHILKLFQPHFIDLLLIIQLESPTGKTRSSRNEAAARATLAKMQKCVSGFDRFNEHSRKMDKTYFTELFLSGNIQSLGIHKKHKAATVYIASGAIQKGIRSIAYDSPRFHAQIGTHSYSSKVQNDVHPTSSLEL